MGSDGIVEVPIACFDLGSCLLAPAHSWAHSAAGGIRLLSREVGLDSRARAEARVTGLKRVRGIHCYQLHQ